MGKTRRNLGLDTVDELANVEGFFLTGCPHCNTSGIVEAIKLRNEGKGRMLLKDLRFQCKKCTRWDTIITPCVVPYDWAIEKLMQRELDL